MKLNNKKGKPQQTTQERKIELIFQLRGNDIKFLIGEVMLVALDMAKRESNNVKEELESAYERLDEILEKIKGDL